MSSYSCRPMRLRLALAGERLRVCRDSAWAGQCRITAKMLPKPVGSGSLSRQAPIGMRFIWLWLSAFTGSVTVSTPFLNAAET